MPNILQTGAAWLGEQLQAHAGQDCTYRHQSWAFSVSLVAVDGDSVRLPGDLLAADGVTARGDDYIALASTLVIDDSVPFLPEYGDEIEWADGSESPLTSVVFPRVDGRCYRYHGPTKLRLQVHTVNAEDLSEITINAPGVPEFSTKGIVTTYRSQEIFDRDETKLLLTSVYIPRSEFAANNITTPPMAASVKINGDAAWAVNLAETEWGPGVVKLGLQRETLVREWQARRNAAV